MSARPRCAILLTFLDSNRERSLQIIASIISMKARKVISDEARRALEYVHGRIMSIAAVQKHLHAPAVGGSIALIPYLTSLCEAISHSIISDDQPISIEVRGQGGNVNRQKAESLGLIVAELVINSLKHAFGNAMQGGSIVLTYTAVETEWSLSVSDNGSGKRERVSNHEGGLGIRHYRGSHPPTECAGRDRKWPPRHLCFGYSSHGRSGLALLARHAPGHG
jgi:two-component sensor histidine kinase